MLKNLTLNEFLNQTKKNKTYIAVYQEISADNLTPVNIIQSLKSEMQQGALLESGFQKDNSARYSFLAFDKIAELRVENNKVLKKINNKITFSAQPPMTALREMLSEFACHTDINIIKSVITTIGFISYNAVRLFESIPYRHHELHQSTSTPAVPDILFNFYQTILVFDHLKQTLLLIKIIQPTLSLEKIYHETQEYINQLIQKIHTPLNQKNPRLNNTAEISNNLNTPIKTDINVDIPDKDFIALIEQAKKYIMLGEAFQIVLSRCYKKTYTAKPFDIYRALRQISPAPYLFYLPIDNDTIIIGASPEKLISVQNKQVQISPIAGTRLNIKANNNNNISNDLLNDLKETAEHVMLVDLARNDLGKICQPGSIKIEELLQVKHYSHVSHITSTVTGILQNNKDCIDALEAAFPAGTLSGAPKIRAMEIINELETSPRGLYGGTICKIDHQGNLDSCIAIRMAVLNNGTATVRCGAGIVNDSNPLNEANETHHKASALLEALALAEFQQTGNKI